MKKNGKKNLEIKSATLLFVHSFYDLSAESNDCAEHTPMITSIALSNENENENETLLFYCVLRDNTIYNNSNEILVSSYIATTTCRLCRLTWLHSWHHFMVGFLFKLWLFSFLSHQPLNFTSPSTWKREREYSWVCLCVMLTWAWRSCTACITTLHCRCLYASTNVQMCVCPCDSNKFRPFLHISRVQSTQTIIIDEFEEKNETKTNNTTVDGALMAEDIQLNSHTTT